MQKMKKQLWESFQDDITELSKPLQDLLRQGFETSIINEEDVIADVDDMDLNIKIIEKFYDLAEKLGIKIITIEEILEKEAEEAKKETKLSQSPAAISVITQEDIRRSGMSSIPELLRTVPGLDVARINANEWAISSRGFNGQYANKLLVLMDGRTIYTPSFAGVYWNAQDTVLEDIDRIEVIRGPGAALWGANAVNGVINITSKSAKETQGFLLSNSCICL